MIKRLKLNKIVIVILFAFLIFSESRLVAAKVDININLGKATQSCKPNRPNKPNKPGKPDKPEKPPCKPTHIYRYYYKRRHYSKNRNSLRDADVKDLKEASSEKSIKAYEAKVEKVFDGDSFSIIRNNVTTYVRLYGIDAPEIGQVYAPDSTKALSAMIKNNKVIIYPIKTDQYGRIIAKVYYYQENNGKRKLVYVNYQQLLRGHAWFYQKLAFKNEKYYPVAEKEAQLSRLGLWAKVNPIRPEKYRKIQHKK